MKKQKSGRNLAPATALRTGRHFPGGHIMIVLPPGPAIV